jgi:hypothetical protein
MKKKHYSALFSFIKEHTKLLNIMKITFLLNWVCLVAFSSTTFSQNQSFTLKLENIKVKEIFKAIENQSTYRFFYNDQLSDINRIVNISVNNSNIQELLSQVFENTDISCTVLENNLIVVAPKRTLQQQKITGTVTDATNGEAIIGANVIIEGTTIGVVTDVNGKFVLDIPKPDAIILVSFLGFNTERIAINGQAEINIKLVPDITKLEEVVVVGYGVQKKVNLTV